MSEIQKYQQHHQQATEQALRQMDRANNNFAQHGLNQNGDPLRSYSSERNDVVVEIQEVETSPAKVKIGAGPPAAMLRMGHDEISKVLPAFPDSIQPQTEPGAWGEPTPQEVFASKQEKSPLEALQKDLYTPQPEQEQEMSR